MVSLYVVVLMASLGTVIQQAQIAGAGQGEPLRAVQTIELPNVEGRIDHMAVDVKGQRLFVAALGNNTIEMIELAGPRRGRQFPDVA